MKTIIEKLLKHVVDVKEIKISDLKFKDIERLRIAKNRNKVRVFVFRYISLGNKISGFLVVPKMKNPQNLPFVIYNRGGTKDFSMVKTEAMFSHVADIANWGYVVIGSQYPGNSLSEGKNEWGEKDLQSVLDLYPLIKKISGKTNPRAGMIGASRGGMMTYLCLKKVKWIKTAIVVSGVANLLRNAQLRPEMQGVFKEAFGGSIAEKKKRSAVFWAGKINKKTPILIMHGTADWRVSVLDAIEIAEKLYKNKIPYKLVIFPGADHSLSEVRQESFDLAKQWLDKYLKNSAPLPNLKPHGK